MKTNFVQTESGLESGISLDKTFFGKKGIHGPIKIKETMDRPENSDPWTTQNIGIHAKNTGINGRFRNIRIYGRFRNIGIHGPIKNIEIHGPVRI